MAPLWEDLDTRPPVVDQRVPKRERRRLGRMSLAILERLRIAPATNSELGAMLPPGAAWRTRVSDCRIWLEGQGETIVTDLHRGGLSVYHIEPKP